MDDRDGIGRHDACPDCAEPFYKPVPYEIPPLSIDIGPKALCQALLDAAEEHGMARKACEMAWGDVEELFRAAFELLTPKQLERFWEDDRVEGLVGGCPEYEAIAEAVYGAFEEMRTRKTRTTKTTKTSTTKTKRRSKRRMTHEGSAGRSTNLRFNVFRSHDPPPVLPKLDQSRLFEPLLGRAHGVLPFLPEMLAVDDAVDRIVAKIGVDRLNEGMLLHSLERPVALQEVQDRFGEDAVRGTA